MRYRRDRPAQLSRPIARVGDPLVGGSSETTIAENIRRLIGEGKSPEQAAAIAYSLAEQG